MEGTTELTAEEIHANSVITEVAIEDLQADRSYQREPNGAMINRIADQWDEVSSELILVSDRGERPEDSEVRGGLWIVNGQHRTLAAHKLGLKHMHARVIDLRDHPDPASIEAQFRLRTNVRMGDKPTERFKAQVRAGNEESLAIVKLVERFGSQINEVPTMESGLNAIAAIEGLYRVDDGALLTETFELIRDIYGAVGGKPSGASYLRGYAWFILKHSEEVDRSRLVEIMHVTGRAALERRGREIQSTMGGTMWLNFYRAIVHFYNERLPEKGKLDWKHGGAASWKGGGNQWGSHGSSSA